MKLVINVDTYKIEACKRRKEEGQNAWYHDMVLNGKPLEKEIVKEIAKELEKIKIEAEENSFKKYNINNEFKCFAIELPILNSIINDHIEELKGEAE